MKVYGLVGLSGTGKSYKSLSLANEKGISYIVDDGLLIRGTKIVAGTSAKREPTKVAAVRRALFMDKAHAKEVVNAIDTHQPDSILILGTSINMINRIANQLKIPLPQEIIEIEDIATSNEIRIAQRFRKEEGTHVIPVPTFEIRKDFSGYFIDPLKIFRIWGKGKKLDSFERTVVRPTFSYMGKFYISDSAIESIVEYNALKVDGVYKISSINITSRIDGIVINIGATISFGRKINEILKDVQLSIVENISHITGINVLKVNAEARGLVIKDKDENKIK